MNTYTVEYDKIVLGSNNVKPDGPYKFSIDAKNMDEASKLAIIELYRIGMRSDYHDVWNAKISDSNNERALLREGGTFVDAETGKPILIKVNKETLESKIKKER